MTNAVTITAPKACPFIEIEREFDAPVAAVFSAHRDPELVKQWLGPHGYEMDIERWDFTTGGGYRYVHRTPEGEEYASTACSTRCARTSSPSRPSSSRASPTSWRSSRIAFDDLGDGRTRLRIHTVYPTVEARDGMVASGMETGMREGYERLDAVVAA